jgi:hypothetical protein
MLSFHYYKVFIIHKQNHISEYFIMCSIMLNVLTRLSNEMSLLLWSTILAIIGKLAFKIGRIALITDEISLPCLRMSWSLDYFERVSRMRGSKFTTSYVSSGTTGPLSLLLSYLGFSSISDRRYPDTT